MISFYRENAKGESITRDSLLLKKDEIQNTEAILRGMARLRSKGWSVPEDIGDVLVEGQVLSLTPIDNA